MSEAPAKPVVLLVEDEPTIRRLARIGIERSGFAVDDVADGRTALARIDDTTRAYVAVVVDLGLPDMPGEDVVRRARAARPDAAVVVSSGSAVAGLGAGIVVVPKPYTPLELGAAVKNAAAGRSLN